MGSSGLAKLLLKYLYDDRILTNNELKKLKIMYAAKTQYNVEKDPNLINVLNGIK